MIFVIDFRLNWVSGTSINRNMIINKLIRIKNELKFNSNDFPLFKFLFFYVARISAFKISHTTVVINVNAI